VGPDLEVGALERQAFGVERALLEIGDVAAGLADYVVVMVLGQLVARPIAEVEATYNPQLVKQIQGAIHRHEPDLGISGMDLLQALVPLLGKRREHSHPLRRR
jgi:hypothetical protein